jgi:hypothetical protein
MVMINALVYRENVLRERPNRIHVPRKPATIMRNKSPRNSDHWCMEEPRDIALAVSVLLLSNGGAGTSVPRTGPASGKDNSPAGPLFGILGLLPVVMILSGTLSIHFNYKY